jgi:quercetin dioxygenase-like cupin family protein
MGATIGSGGTALSQAAWLPVLRFLGMRPWFESAVLISDAARQFDSDGRLGALYRPTLLEVTDSRLSIVREEVKQSLVAALIGKSPSRKRFNMKTIQISVIAVLIVDGGPSLQLARGQQAGEIKRIDPATVSAAGSTHSAPPRETVTAVANTPIPNLPGKRLVSRVIDYPPGGGSVPHRHARSAFIYAYVLSGLIRSQVDDEPARVFRPGETWFESPGAHHRVSENASDTEPARLLAVIVVDAADDQLTIPDRR